MQTSIFRPRMIDFEDRGGFLPAHSVGAWATGKTSIGPGKITCDAYLSNGPSIRERTLDFGGFTDNDTGKLLGFNLGYEPAGALSGLVVGVHGFGASASVYDPNGAVLSKSRWRMFGGYFGYDTDNWNAIVEVCRYANADLGNGARHTSSAGFVQVGRQLGPWTPFVRYQRAALDSNDPFFASQNAGRSYRRSSLGLGYNIDPKSAFKLELSSTREPTAVQFVENGDVCTPSRAGEVIAHPLIVLSAEEVPELFMGDKQLAGSLKLVPVNHRAQQADFLVKVVQMDPTRYTARWTKKAFREGLNTPMAKGSDAEVAAFVRVGYVSAAGVGVQKLQKY